jgi:hypothetical protein
MTLGELKKAVDLILERGCDESFPVLITTHNSGYMGVRPGVEISHIYHWERGEIRIITKEKLVKEETNGKPWKMAENTQQNNFHPAGECEGKLNYFQSAKECRNKLKELCRKWENDDSGGETMNFAVDDEFMAALYSAIRILEFAEEKVKWNEKSV